jgi:hypothetical protein
MAGGIAIASCSNLDDNPGVLPDVEPIGEADSRDLATDWSGPGFAQGEVCDSECEAPDFDEWRIIPRADGDYCFKLDWAKQLCSPGQAHLRSDLDLVLSDFDRVLDRTSGVTPCEEIICSELTVDRDYFIEVEARDTDGQSQSYQLTITVSE